MTDRYQITSLIEKDQLGSVYLAQDTTLQRKVVYRDFETAGSAERPEGFSQYTGKLCALQHPNLLTIFDIATSDSGYYMVTQFLEGESLVDRLSQGALNYVGVHNMACDLLDALHSAHSSGLFHGALRADSIKRLTRVRGGHRYLIVDFGLDRISAMICGTHVIMADPVLRAPELIGGKVPPDGRSDLFTLGQLCYIALVGGHPYAGKTPEECAQAYRDGGLPHLSTYVQGVQQDFANWVMWLVRGDPEQRPYSSHEAMESLHAITLKAPEPNVPGVTQAVDVPEAPAPNQPKISEPVRVSSEPVAKSAKPAKHRQVSSPSKGGKFFLAAVGAVVVLLVILILILVFRDDSSDTGASSDSSSKTEMVQMQKNQWVDELLTRRNPVNINFDGDEVIDWTVVTGVPASSARTFKKTGSYIRNILALGEFTESVASKPSVIYQAGGAIITPQRGVTGSERGNAQQGNGWQIDLRVPKEHQGALLVSLFMIQSHCGFLVEVRSTHEDNEGEVVKLNVPRKSPGVVRVPLRIADPKPGYYSIRVLAEAPSVTDDFEMGLSAILVERA